MPVSGLIFSHIKNRQCGAKDVSLEQKYYVYRVIESTQITVHTFEVTSSSIFNKDVVDGFKNWDKLKV